VIRTSEALLTQRAIANGDRVFVQEIDAATTYREFDVLVSRLASGLAGLGVAHGDRVCLGLPNGLDFLVASFALMRLGAVQVPLSLEYRSAQVSYVVADADARVLICSGEFYAEHAEVIEKSVLTTVVSTAPDLPAGHVTVRAWCDVAATEASFVPGTVAPSDPVAIIYTSGTTADPKGVLLCHEHELTLAENIAASIDLTADDCFYNFYPLHHNTGLGIITGAVLVAGARMLLTDRFSHSRFWTDVADYGCTVFYGMGPILEILLKDDVDTFREHGLTTCFGIAIGDDQAERFAARYGVRFVTGYGSTETNMVAIGVPDPSRPGAAGRVLPDFEVAIVDDTDEMLPPDSVGEIVVRPRRPYVTSLGYWRKGAETAEAWRNLWVHTGDAGRVDADGYVYFVDRLKDVIRHRGNNVSSVEVENVILTVTAVSEAAVIPVASDLGEYDQDICAVVVARPGASVDPAAIIKVCAEQLPSYAVPRYVELVDELPKTPTGKVRKAQLRSAPPSGQRWDRQAQVTHETTRATSRKAED
jgi:carnitine-CoA ligase